MAEIDNFRGEGNYDPDCDGSRWIRNNFFQPFRHQTVIFDWLNDPKMERLCFGIGSSGGLTVFSNFPNTTKSKICYFLRKMPIALTADNIRSVS